MKRAYLVIILSILVINTSSASDAPLVAAASSLRHVWPLLMQDYAAEPKPRITFGSSGNLSRQISQSAPFELFLSADQTYPENLHQRGLSLDKPVPYAIGALAWVALEKSVLADWIQSEFEATSGTVPFVSAQQRTLAIANPAFAPYGIAADQVLKEYNLNAHPRLKLTLGENAAQTLQFALSGATDGGIVPLSLVSGAARSQLPPLVVGEVATTLHEPLIHTMVLINQPSAAAQSLYHYLLSNSAKTIFIQNGFRAIN